jgi:predicted methyltransferase
MYYFYDIAPGTAGCTGNIMKFAPKEIKSLQHDRSKLCKGNVFQPVDEDAERVGYEILVGDRQQLTIDTVEQMEKNFMKEFII